MARNASGTMTRVSNSFSGPSSGTPISSTHAEALFDDFDTELTDSLCRSGKGAMLADLDHGAFSALFAERSSPSNPSANVLAVFAKDVSTITRLHWRDNAGTEDVLVGRASTDTLTNKTMTSPVLNTPDINAGTADSLTSLSIRSTGAAFDLTFRSIEVLTNSRTLTFDVGDAARQITLGGNLTLGGTLTTAGAATISAYGATIIDDANAAAALTTLGVSAYAQTILDDATAGDAQTTLGISAFVKTILDDADAAAVRATIGVGLGTGDLVAANNLSDVASADTSRVNLGIQYTLIDVQIFTSSGTWNMPSGTDAVEVWTVGGGGGGGGADGDAGTCGMGGGGGAGGIAYEWIDSGLASMETVTVGTGGAGGAAGNNAGTAGVTSSFGAHNSATGGDGGSSLANGAGATWTPGGAGGIGSGGDMNIAGGCGVKGIRLSATVPIAGEGGSNMFSGGGKNNNSGDAVGVAGRGYGGGGSGGSANSATDRAGGAGADGVVIVKSYKI